MVAFSALPLDTTSAWFRESAFVGYIEKPIDVQELPGQVRRYCAEGLELASD